MALLSTSFSPIGFGAFKIGRNRGIKYERHYDLPEPAAVDRLLNGVLDLGINYIDTAPAYGESEERIGQALARRRGGFLLSTKVGEFFENDGSRYDFSEKAVRASVESSLRRLRTEAIDFVFIHSSRDDARVVRETDVVASLIKLRDAGVVRGIGLSGYTAEAFRATFAWADAMMVTYHPEDTSLAPVMAEAADRGIAVIVKKGLGSGRLSPADAIPFVLQHPAVTSVAIASLSLEHLRENVRWAETVRPALRAVSGSERIA